MAVPTLVYTTRTGNPNHALAVQRMHEAPTRPAPVACRVDTPEPHRAGEFHMTCFACAQVADGEIDYVDGRWIFTDY